MNKNKRQRLTESTEHVKLESKSNQQINEFYILSEAEKDGKAFKIFILQNGWSKNGFYYSDELLKEYAPLFENAKVFAYEFQSGMYNHLPNGEQIPEGYSKNTAGWIDKVKFETIDGKTGLTGIFNITDDFFRMTFKNSFEQGKKDLLGFSIDAEGDVLPAFIEGRQGQKVTKFHIVNSVDIVTFPSAGGEVVRLIASMQNLNQRGKKEMNIFKVMAGFIRENQDQFKAQIKEGVDIEKMDDKELVFMAMDIKESTDEETKKEDETEETETEKTEEETKEEEIKEAEISEQQIKKLMASISGNKIDEAMNFFKKMLKDKKTKTKESEMLNQIDDKFKEINEKVDSLKVRESQIAIKEALQDQPIPEETKTKILTQFEGKVVDIKEAEKVIEAEKAYLAKITESDVVVGLGGVETGRDRTDKLQASMDLMLGYKPEEHEKDAYKDVQGFRSIKEAYIEFTGDKYVTQQYDKRIMESTTSDFPQAMGTSMQRRMVQEYRRLAIQESWRKLVTSENIDNFKQNDVIRIGGFTNLPTVTEDNAYTYFSSPSEVKASYSASKKGKLFTVTWEMIRNDDLGIVKKFPVKMAQSANRTLAVFVFDLLLNYGGGAINGGTYAPDSKALYHADHNNLTDDVLDYNSLDSAITAMMNQAEADSGEVLDLRPQYLVVPAELRSLAKVLIDSEKRPVVATTNGVATGTNESINPVYKAVEPIVVPNYYLRADQNNWYMTANKEDIENVVVGFLDGKQEPDLFLQDQPTVGQVFTQDRITYKVRHVYGGVVPDYRGLYAGIVTGIS